MSESNVVVPISNTPSGQGRITYRDGSVRGYGAQTVEQMMNEGAVGRMKKCLYECGLHQLVPLIRVNRIGDVAIGDLLNRTDRDDLLLVCRAWWLSGNNDPRMSFEFEEQVLEWYWQTPSGRARLAGAC